jgi:hypothetical protein
MAINVNILLVFPDFFHIQKTKEKSSSISFVVMSDTFQLTMHFPEAKLIEWQIWHNEEQMPQHWEWKFWNGYACGWFKSM